MCERIGIIFRAINRRLSPLATLLVAVVAVVLTAAGPATAVYDPPEHSTATLTQARLGISAASSNEQVLFAGGYAGNGSTPPSAVVNAYSVTSGWSVADPLSIPRGGLSAAGWGDRVFVGGGWNGSAMTDRVDIYNTASGVHSTASLSVARSNLAATAAGSRVFFGGGRTGTGYTGSSVLDVLDATDGSLLSSINLSVARYGLAAASGNGKVFFGGGVVRNGEPWTCTDTVDIFDAATLTPLTPEHLSVARGALASISAGGLIFFAGGVLNSGFAISDRLDIYDTVSGSWLPTQNLSEARYALAAASAGGLVFFGGGIKDASGNKSNHVDIFDLATRSLLPYDPDLNLSVARGDIAAASWGNQVLFAGGQTGGIGGAMSNVVDIYTTPEPATLSLLALGGLALLRRRGR